MRCTTTALVLATLAIGQATAASLHGHAHFHTKKEAKPSPMEVRAPVEAKRQATDLLTSAASTLLSTIGCLPGTNAQASGAAAWLGADGAYTNEFTNNSTESLILVIWGPDGSWVNVAAPLVTLSMEPGDVQTVSFATGTSGAWSAVYSDTDMVNGQVSNTWGEYTFSPTGVVDVSREVNMLGHDMSIVGPTCTTDMNTCVFVCPSGDTCWTEYLLENCDNGSQEGATYGEYFGSPSGGCGWNGASSAALKTTLS